MNHFIHFKDCPFCTKLQLRNYEKETGRIYINPNHLSLRRVSHERTSSCIVKCSSIVQYSGSCNNVPNCCEYQSQKTTCCNCQSVQIKYRTSQYPKDKCCDYQVPNDKCCNIPCPDINYCDYQNSFWYSYPHSALCNREMNLSYSLDLQPSYSF